MKTTLSFLAAFFAVVFAVSPASATVYNFSYEFPDLVVMCAPA